MKQGLGVSTGIAYGKVLVYTNTNLKPTGKLIRANKIEEEKAKVKKAISQSVEDINKILNTLDEERDELMVDLMEIQIELTEDPMLWDKINEYIEFSVNNALDAVLRATYDMADMFSNMENEYYRARAADIKDVGMRIANHVLGVYTPSLSELNEDYIIVAKDLTPSETVTMDKNHVLGFITSMGSKTSHTSILARTLEIPAIVGADISAIHTGQWVIVDGASGEIRLNPEEHDLKWYKEKQAEYRRRGERLEALKNICTATGDGRRVELCINIAEPSEALKAAELGADGIGLFRSEFLYMDSKGLPDEQTQLLAYKAAAVNANSAPVIIRTLDIGGDKSLSYLDIPEEENPFLGYRAVRICLDNPPLFKTQLRALLRASVFGDIRIMFPMICCQNELFRCKQLLSECKEELLKQNIPFRDDIKIGMMVEIPSAAAAAEIFAREVDFFSIGTNDLCQYTLAVDRMNAKISSLYTHFNPGVLRLIAHTIEAGHEAGIPVGMCGEMASDPLAAPLLIGWGLDEFSVNQSQVLSLKERIRKLTVERAREITETVMKMDSSTNIVQFLEGQLL